MNGPSIPWWLLWRELSRWMQAQGVPGLFAVVAVMVAATALAVAVKATRR